MPDSSAPTVSDADRRAYALRKLFSLTGVVPIGVFVIAHLGTYSTALLGRDALDRALEASRSPYGLVVEVVLVWLPLVFHAGYGIKVLFEGRSNASRYPFARNWSYVMQRLSAVVVLAFIAAHFFEFRLPLLRGKLAHQDLFYELCASLSSTAAGGVPWIALGYLLGLAATAYHLANGLSGFCFSWGIVNGRRGLARVHALTGLLGVIVFAVGANSVIYFSTGSRFSFSATRYEGSTPPLTCRDVGASDAGAAPGAVLTGSAASRVAALGAR